MALKIGIIGLPNVGKSTLFSAITHVQSEINNYPFVTINPNTAITNVPDKRVDFLTDYFKSKKSTYANLEMIDIAGLIKGASKGEGLGNKFLGNIREVDLICHVVRCFKNKTILHVHNTINPLEDIEDVNLELIFADLEQAERIHQKLIKNNKSSNAYKKEIVVLEKIIKTLESNNFLNTIVWDEKDYTYMKSLGLLTLKKVVYVANIDENDVSNPLKNELFKKLTTKVSEPVIAICAKLDHEISLLSKNERIDFLNEMNLPESGLDALVSACYKKLNLKTFLTAGEKESRAWTFKEGMLAPQCAGIIHTDFEKGFIKAEIYNFKSLKQWKTINEIKNKGLVRTEGKKYHLQDGDVCLFRFNI